MTTTTMTWKEICSDPDLRKLPHKIEQDRFGRVIMSPPPMPRHGKLQARIIACLVQLAPDWTVYGDPSVQTSGGVRSPDVAASPADRERDFDDLEPLPRAPAICIEILSPRNSDEEMVEKRLLYAEAGCEEFWICASDGTMTFLSSGGAPLEKSKLCPAFPGWIEL